MPSDPTVPESGSAPASAPEAPAAPEVAAAEGETEIELEAGDSSAKSPEVVALEAKLALLSGQLEESFARARETQNRLKEEHERLLRTAAEFDNFKKRAQREKEDVQKFGVERLLKDFLPVADNLDRALDSASQHDPKQVIEGVKLVQKMLEQTLAKHGVTGFSAVGQPFDPALHEALMQQESDLPPNTVVSEMARGYKLNERLVRPAAVVVAKARAAPAAPPEGAATGGASPDEGTNPPSSQT